MNEAISKAIEFAVKAHEGQFRKIPGDMPYVFHPLGVGKLLLEHGCGETLAIAGILHDTVEDTDVTLDDLRERFGDEVARLVEGASEPDKSKSWEERKQHTIEYLNTAPADVLALVCADKLDNLRDFRHEFRKIGDTAWRHMKRGPEKQKWYYTSIAAIMRKRLAGDKTRPMVEMYSEIVEELFGPER